MALLKELTGLLTQLSNPKFLAHLLEPVLLWGVFFGMMSWMVSLWLLKSRKAQVCSLILLAATAFCIFPVMHYRTKARPMTAPSVKLRDDQNERRRDTQWAYYSLGSLALLGIFMTGEGKGKAGTLVTFGLIGGGLATTILSLWLHEKEVSVFHEDARRGQRAARAAQGTPGQIGCLAPPPVPSDREAGRQLAAEDGTVVKSGAAGKLNLLLEVRRFWHVENS